MYIKVFPHGKGNGRSPTQYLVRLDYPNRKENPPVVLRGSVEETQKLIDSLFTKWKFSAGVLSWHPQDNVSKEQEEEIMDSFERLAFAGLEHDRRNILWVRHCHAKHHELHFVIPRAELYGGKAYNPFPPGWQKSFDVLRDYFNVKYDWARPDDPKRARLFVPEQADLQRARFIRYGKAPLKKEEREQAKEAIHTYLIQQIENGKITNRAGIIACLEELGLQINRQGKDYLTVIDPTSKEKLRLKGAMYAEQFDITSRENQSQSRTGTDRSGSSIKSNLSRLAGELEHLIQKRSAYNRKRYPQQSFTFGEVHRRGLWGSQRPVEQTVSQSSLLEFGNSSHNKLDSGRDNGAGIFSDEYLESRDTGTERTKGADRSSLYQGLEQVQGLGILSLSGGKLSADAAELADNFIRNKGKTECLENQQGLSVWQDISINVKKFQDTANYCNVFQHISNSQTILSIKEKADDRDRTHAQRNTACPAKGNSADAGQSGGKAQRAGAETANPDGADSTAYGRKSGFTVSLDPIRRNLAGIEFCIQELKSLAHVLAGTLEKVRGRGR